jgi:RNA polymerase sigma factor for flagellar operon FliA
MLTPSIAVLAPSGPNLEEWFVSLLPVLDRIISFEVRRHHGSADTHEEFRSQVHLRLIENDYAILRKFEGRSTIQTFLTTVVVNQFKDYLNRELGKWRPSAVAKRLGPAAVQLERCLIRDGLSFDEACNALATKHGITSGREELEEFAAKLPLRFRRRYEAEAVIEHVPAPGGTDHIVIDSERRARLDEVMAVLGRERAAMTPEDATIVALRFEDGRKVSEIAVILRLPQKPLYDRIKKLTQQLRSRLEADGIDAVLVRELLDED